MVAPPDRDVLDNLRIAHAVTCSTDPARRGGRGGAEVREEFTVDDLLFDGERVVGVRGHARHGLTVEERARIVVGADGKRLFVARRVGARSVSRARADDDGVLLVLQRYRSDRHGPVRRYGRGGLRLADNDGLSIKGIMRPGRDKAWYRDDIEANMMSDFEMVMPEWAERIRAGRREERISGSIDTPSFFRQAFGPGWCSPVTPVTRRTRSRRSASPMRSAPRTPSPRRSTKASPAGVRSTKRSPTTSALDEKVLPVYTFTPQLSSFPNSRTREELRRRGCRQPLPHEPPALDDCAALASVRAGLRPLERSTNASSRRPSSSLSGCDVSFGGDHRVASKLAM